MLSENTRMSTEPSLKNPGIEYHLYKLIIIKYINSMLIYKFILNFQNYIIFYTTQYYKICTYCRFVKYNILAYILYS